jgi:flagellar capping protein FliD
MNTEQKLHGVHYDYTIILRKVRNDITRYNNQYSKNRNEYGESYRGLDRLADVLTGLRQEEELLTQFINSIEDVLGYSPSRNYPKE